MVTLRKPPLARMTLTEPRVAAELLRRQPDGQWPDEPAVLGSDDLLTLSSVAYTVPLRAIYRTTVLAMP
jgi:hypothetical protein